MKAIFSCCGNGVKRVVLPLEGGALVLFHRWQDAEFAMDHFNGNSVGDYQLSVVPARNALPDVKKAKKEPRRGNRKNKKPVDAAAASTKVDDDEGDAPDEVVAETSAE